MTSGDTPTTPRGRPVERAIVLQLLRCDHARSWSREELQDALAYPDAQLEQALRRLQDASVVVPSGQRLKASPCLRYLDQLDIFAV